jgi:hypothetical protein
MADELTQAQQTDLLQRIAQLERYIEQALQTADRYTAAGQGVRALGYLDQINGWQQEVADYRRALLLASLLMLIQTKQEQSIRLVQLGMHLQAEALEREGIQLRAVLKRVQSEHWTSEDVALALDELTGTVRCVLCDRRIEAAEADYQEGDMLREEPLCRQCKQQEEAEA